MSIDLDWECCRYLIKYHELIEEPLHSLCPLISAPHAVISYVSS